MAASVIRACCGRTAVVPALLLGIAVSCGPSRGTEPTAPLQVAIDELVENAAVGPLAPRCSDADFVRRIHLDLAGVIPTASQVRAFLADTSPHKRARLVEELLSGPAFARHMMFLLDAMLLERARPPGDLAAAWQEYLFATLDEDRPLDELARDLLVSDGGDASTRAASSFLLTRQAEPVQLTRAIGRLYFGRDLQCAQCHDHPLDDDIRQEEYQGLYAFVVRTSLFKGKGNQLLVSEKADGEVDYQSVFTQEGEKGVWPRLPGGTTVIAEPRPEPPAAYVEQPSKTSRGVPAFSRRMALAERLADHEGFRRNLANRIWAMFFGVGLVHPLDRVGPDNPPAHPALLTLLADALVDHGFRLRPLVRGIVLSETYQRSIDPPRPHDVDRAAILQVIVGLERQRDACNDTAAARAQAAQEAETCWREAAAAARTEHVKRLELVAARDQALAASASAAAAAAKAGATFDRIRKTSDPLAAAARHVARAADLVAGDEPLAVLSRTLADQVRRTTAATAEASRSLDEARAAATAAAAALVAARGSVATVTLRLGADSLTSLERAAVAARTAATEARHDVDNLDARLALARDLAAHAELRDADPSAADVAWQTIVDRWTRAGQVAPMRPLTAEQLALSVQQATGALAARHASAVAAVDKASPESPAGSGDDDRDEIRAMQVEMRMVKDAADLLRSTASLFGDALSEGFQASVNQALYFGNAPDIQGQLAPAGTNLVATLGRLGDPASVAEEAYVAVLSRPPSPDERADVAAFLAPRSQDRPQAIGELVWALISSNEFRFNH